MQGLQQSGLTRWLHELDARGSPQDHLQLQSGRVPPGSDTVALVLISDLHQEQVGVLLEERVFAPNIAKEAIKSSSENSSTKSVAISFRF